MYCFIPPGLSKGRMPRFVNSGVVLEDEKHKVGDVVPVNARDSERDRSYLMG